MEIHNTIINKLLKGYKEISLLEKIKATLNWDLNVNLPPKASQSRAEESAYLSKVITNKWLDKDFKQLVQSCAEQKDLSEEESAIVRNVTNACKYYYKVPKEIIIKKDEVTSEAFTVWKKAREENTFVAFQPYLEKIIDIEQTISQHLGFIDNSYDALLNLYEPELTAKYCEEMFTGLKNELVPLTQKVIQKQNAHKKISFITKDSYFPISSQEKLTKFVIEKMGFDLESGRVDVSPHPFTTALALHDVRLTTHYNIHDFREALTSSIHEAGHGLYEQGINPVYSSTPLEFGVSYGVHEGMSRFWENMVGKNPAFLSYLYPILQSYFEEELVGVSEESFINSLNTVAPSLIRIHADELTYSLHIILRFEMENALMNGTLKVKDAPEAWNQKAKELFGITPSTDSEGILQDVHWTYGDFGYFPSYALGNLYGAQILDTMRKEIAFDKELQKGNLVVVKDWLDSHIHTFGSFYYPKDLIKKVTGKELNFTYFVEYLKEKYNGYD